MPRRLQRLTTTQEQLLRQLEWEPPMNADKR